MVVSLHVGYALLLVLMGAIGVIGIGLQESGPWPHAVAGGLMAVLSILVAMLLMFGGYVIRG